jgi:UDP-glucose 4-epimerase
MIAGVRDYIHIVDLALGHIAALKKFKEKPGLISQNSFFTHSST